MWRTCGILMRQQLYLRHGTLQWGPDHRDEAENWRVCGFNSASSLSLFLGSPTYKMYLHNMYRMSIYFIYVYIEIYYIHWYAKYMYLELSRLVLGVVYTTILIVWSGDISSIQACWLFFLSVADATSNKALETFKESWHKQLSSGCNRLVVSTPNKQNSQIVELKMFIIPDKRQKKHEAEWRSLMKRSWDQAATLQLLTGERAGHQASPLVKLGLP